MKLVVVAATDMELNEAREKYRHTNILFTTCGIGMMQCAATISKLCLVHQPGFVIQAGIAGSFGDIYLGTTVAIKEELLADTGVLENNIWKDIFDLGLQQKDNPPFQNKKLINPHIAAYNLLQLPCVTGVSVNKISTGSKEIETICRQYQPSVESMEGAALHYVCNDLQVPYIQLRTISNMVGERDKTRWKMKEALLGLNTTLIAYIDALANIHSFK